MKTTVRCPHCDTAFQVAEETLGRKARCGRCGKSFSLANPCVETVHSSAAEETEKPAPERDIPTRVGRYEIRQQVGAGAFGTVYRAYDGIVGREVALKVPHRQVLAREEDRARFLGEAQAAGQLRHPHIVPVYDAMADGDQAYIVSAFIEGPTLERRLDEGRPDYRESARIVIALAGALDYAHQLAVVHRDVKPANILLDSRGDPLLADFGLALLREAQDRLAEDGEALGTPAYMSPEQADSRWGEIGPASDQYSLGVVLYELLCGERPFSGLPSQVISLVANEEPPSPREHDRRIPRDLEAICLKAMVKHPLRRYGACAELGDDLRRWLNGEPIRARRVGPIARAARWCRRKPLAASLLAGVVLVAALGAAAVDWYRGQAGEAFERQQIEARAKREALKRASRQESRAEEKGAQLASQKKQTRQETRRADVETIKARQARQAERSVHYVSLIAKANELRLAQRGQEVLKLLDECPEDLRRWEWHFLRSRCASLLPGLDGESLVLVDELGLSMDRMTIHRDGLLAATDGFTVVIIDIATGEVRHRLQKPPSQEGLIGLGFTADGELLAAMTPSGTKMAWRLTTGEMVTTPIPVGGGEVKPATFFTAGKPGFSAQLADDGRVQVRETTEGRRLLHTIDPEPIEPGRKRSVYFTRPLAISADGRYLVAPVVPIEQETRGGEGGVLRIWDLASDTNYIVARGTGPCSFSPHGPWLVYSTPVESGVWDLARGKQHFALPVDSGPLEQFVYPEVDRIATLNVVAAGDRREARLQLWDVQTGAELISLDASAREGSYLPAWLHCTPDGTGLFVNGEKFAKYWGTTPVAPRAPPPSVPKHKAPVKWLAVSPDGRRVVSSDGGTITAWDVQTGKETLSFTLPEVRYGRRWSSSQLAASPDVARVAMADEGEVRLYDVADGGMTSTVAADYGSAQAGSVLAAIAFSPNGELLATAGPSNPLAEDRDGKVTKKTELARVNKLARGIFNRPKFRLDVWDAVTGEKRGQVVEGTMWYGADFISFLGGNDQVAVVMDDGKLLKVFDVAKWRPLFVRRIRTPPSLFSPDGTMGLFREKQGGLVLRGLRDEVLHVQFGVVPYEVVAFSADGRLLAVGAGGALLVFDAQSAKPLEVRQENLATASTTPVYLTALAFSGDGRWLAVGRSDGLVSVVPLSQLVASVSQADEGQATTP